MIELAWMREVLSAKGQLAHYRRGKHGITGASQDSRVIQWGELFVALPGAQADGHAFAAAALDAGAGGALISDPALFGELSATHPDAALFLVPDPLAALQELAGAWIREVDPAVIAITGSNGKTGTKDLTSALLSTLGRSFASAGNYNNLIGLPMSVLRLPRGSDYAVLEMGCSGFGEIARLCEIFQPTIGVVTNIGAAHLEQLGDLDGVARAKGELPAALPAGGLCVLPAEDPYTPALQERCDGCRIHTFGLGEQCTLRVEDLGPSGPGARRVRVDGIRFEFPRPARHHLLALAAAWTVARDLGGIPDHLAAAAAACRPPGNRGTLYRLGPWRILDDSYNANPASLRAALEWLAEMPGEGRRWAILGDMLELGEQGPALHAECGRAAAASGIHALWACGPLSSSMVEAAGEAGLADTRHFEDPESLAEALAPRLRDGDWLLVKGSRGMAMERVLKALEQKLGEQREVLS